MEKKIIVIKTLALPILVQCFTVLPDPPDHIIKSLQNIFYAFIWNDKTDKIKRSTLICNYSAPIQTTCVLSKFALSPEQMEKAISYLKLHLMNSHHRLETMLSHQHNG
jgi:hypothetical protein